MKQSKIMRERIHRVRVLFKELGYEIHEGENNEFSYSGGFEKHGTFSGGFFIDSDSRFLEIAFSFSFSGRMAPFIRERLEEMMTICYEYGCYMNLQKFDDFTFSIFSKIYFAGLNYYALKETLKDFNLCVESLKEILDIGQSQEEDENNENT